MRIHIWQFSNVFRLQGEKLAEFAIYYPFWINQILHVVGVSLQVVRDWVLRFNAAGPDGLLDRKAAG